MTSYPSLLNCLVTISDTGAGGEAGVHHGQLIIVGLIAMVVFMGGLEWVRKLIPSTLCWDRTLILFGRILIHSAWIFAVLVFYTRTWRHFDMPKAISFRWVCLVVLVAWWALRQRVLVSRSPYLLPGALFALVMVIQCFMGVNMAEGWEDLTKFALAVMFVVTACHFIHRLNDLRLFSFLLGFISFVVALYGLGQYFDWPLCYHAPWIDSFDSLKTFLSGAWSLLIGDSFRLEIQPRADLMELRNRLMPGADDKTSLIYNTVGYWTQMPSDILSLVLQQHLHMTPLKFTMKAVSFMGNENYTAEFVNISFPICFCLFFYYWGRPLGMAFFALVNIANITNLLYIDCNASYVGMAASLPLMMLILLFGRIVPWFAKSKIIPGATHEQVHQWTRTGVFVLVVLAAISSAVVTSTENPVRRKLTILLSWVDLDGDYKPDGAAPQVFRLECMDATIRKIAECFPFGIGPGNFKVIHPLYESQLERKVLGEETLARKVHNDILYHAVEYGAVGMFAFIWMMTMAYFLIFRTLSTITEYDRTGERPRRGPPLSADIRNYLFYFLLGCAGGITTALTSCNFGHTFVIPGGMTTLYTVICMVGVVHQRVHLPVPRLVNPQLYESPASDPSPVKKVWRQYWQASPLVRWAVSFAILIPIGVHNVRPMLAECFMKLGMDQHEPSTYGTCEYREMLKNFALTEKLWPYQMELYYIFGRYCIDAYNYIDSASRGEDELVNQIAASRGVDPKDIWMDIVRQGYQIEPADKLIWLLRGIRVLQYDLLMNPNYKWAHNNLGVLYEKVFGQEFQSFVTEQFGTGYGSGFARRSYARTLTIDDEQIYGLFNTGLGYMREGKWDEAIQPFVQSLAVDPQKTEILIFLAKCFAQTEVYDRARLACDRFVDVYKLKNPNDPNGPWVYPPALNATVADLFTLYQYLGNAFYQQGNKRVAAHCFKAGLQANPYVSDVNYLYMYGDSLISSEINDMTSAIPVFEKIVNSENVNQDVLGNSLRYYIVALDSVYRDIPKVLNALEMLVALMPDDPLIHFNIARVRIQSGSSTMHDILTELNQAIILDPTDIPERIKQDPYIQALFVQYPEVKQAYEAEWGRIEPNADARSTSAGTPDAGASAIPQSATEP